MLNMKKFRESLNQQVNGKVAATIIGISAIIIPIFGLRDLDWQKVELGFLSILISLLYVVVIAGFVFLALGKQGKNITPKETDEKIARIHSRIQKKLVPVGWMLTAAWIVWIGYFVWKL